MVLREKIAKARSVLLSKNDILKDDSLDKSTRIKDIQVMEKLGEGKFSQGLESFFYLIFQSIEE